MPPKYKLIYFDFEGRDQPIKFLLSFAGKEFDDVRISMDDWKNHKAGTPFGQLPLLEVDGKQMYQSAAISRYLAIQCGLMGSYDLENYEIDAVADTVQDLTAAIYSIYEIQNEDAKKKKMESLKNETIPFYTSKLDNLVKNNKGYLVNGKKLPDEDQLLGLRKENEEQLLQIEALRQQNKQLQRLPQIPLQQQQHQQQAPDAVTGNHPVIQQLTWADVFFASLVGSLSFTMGYDVIANCANLISLKKKVFDLPAIKALVAKQSKKEA